MRCGRRCLERVARALGLVALVAQASAGAADDDLEARYREDLQRCKDDGRGAVRGAEARVRMRRPRLLPSLPSLDVTRYCDCKLAGRRAAFGLERALRIESLGPGEGLPSDEYVRLMQQDETLVLDCIEQAATGTLRHADPQESAYAELVDGCRASELGLQAVVVVAAVAKDRARGGARREDDPIGPLTARARSVDQERLCACYFDSQREEYGLSDTLAFNSMAAQMAPGSRRVDASVLQRKGEIFEACLQDLEGGGSGNLAPPDAGSGEQTGGSAARPAPGARRGRWLAALLAVATLAVGLACWVRRRSSGRRPPARRVAPARPAPRARR